MDIGIRLWYRSTYWNPKNTHIILIQINVTKFFLKILYIYTNPEISNAPTLYYNNRSLLTTYLLRITTSAIMRVNKRAAINYSAITISENIKIYTFIAKRDFIISRQIINMLWGCTKSAQLLRVNLIKYTDAVFVNFIVVYIWYKILIILFQYTNVYYFFIIITIL